MVANLQIHDAERYREYEKGFFPILKKHGGELSLLMMTILFILKAILH